MTREEQIEIQANYDDCCYVENNYEAFKRGIEWADEHPKDGIVNIEKVLNWLENINTDNYMDSGIFQMYDLIRDFRKAMEE